MLETPKALDTIIFNIISENFQDITMDNQQETNKVTKTTNKTNKQNKNKRFLIY